MTYVTYKDKKIFIQPKQSVLDALLNNGEKINHFCKNGLCQNCIMEIEHGNIPEISQQGLTPAEKIQNKFLPCICFPREDLGIKQTNTIKKWFACEIINKNIIQNEFIILNIKKPVDYKFFPGQYLNILKNESCIRTYSIANLCETSNELELHIKVYPNGEMSYWIFHELTEGNTIHISNAMGNCFYMNEAKHKPLLLLGVGTGVAPLIGICRQAIFSNHNYPIHFIQAGANKNALYANDILNNLKKQSKHFNLHSCHLDHIENNNVLEYINKTFNNLENWEVYICGQPKFVNEAKEITFLLGADANAIHSDSFFYTQ